MKYLLTFLILYSMLHSKDSFGQLNPKQNADAALYSTNKVKCVKVYKYRTKKLRGKGRLTSFTKFDTLGRETEVWSLLKLNFYTSTEYHVLYKYNENGDVEEQTSFVIKNSDPLITTYTYLYDDQKRVIYKKVNRDFGEIWQHTYDLSGNLISTKWYLSGDQKGNSFFFIDSFYYANNLQTEMKRYRPDNSLYFHFIYEYDEQGNRIKETRFEHDRVTDIWQRTFDEKGNCISLHHIDKLTGEETRSSSQFTEQNLRIFSGKKGKFVYEYY